jgi:hypothetical protein
MRYFRIRIAKALPGLGLGICIGCVACSDASNARDATAGLQIGLTLGAHTSAAISTSSAGADAGPASTWPDDSWAAAIRVPPGTTCSIHPEGASNDPSRIDSTAAAEDDGEIRFYAPPPNWGKKLTLDCSLDGSSQGQYFVDLNAPSTFVRKSAPDLAATVKVVGKTSGLTGDLSALSPIDLLQRGYPPPPNRVTQPDLYSLWTQSVSRPATRYKFPPVLAPGLRGNGLPGGSSCSGAWTGFTQAAVGFTSTNCLTNFATSNSQLYESYVANTIVPQANSCPGGPCTTLIWAGIGGGHELFDGEELGGNGTPSNLIQHGFLVGGSNNVQYYWEYFGGSAFHLPIAWPAPIMAVGDPVALVGAGWSGNNCSGTVDPSAPYACFYWYDLKNNNYGYAYAQKPSNGIFWPATAEYVVEVPAGSSGNATYNAVTMTGYAVDWNGNAHYDPGSQSGTDPYIPNQQGDFNSAFWANLSTNNAVDPMIFVSRNYQ